MTVLVLVHIFAPMDQSHVTCYQDTFHDFTLPVIVYFEENVNTKNFLLITSGLISDFVLLAMLYKWQMNCKSWRLPIALTFIYIAKLITTQVFNMRMPERHLWEFPGWYSLQVQYGPSNSTHFVLHVAIMLAVTLELYSLRSSLFLLSLVSLLF